MRTPIRIALAAALLAGGLPVAVFVEDIEVPADPMRAAISEASVAAP